MLPEPTIRKVRPSQHAYREAFERATHQLEHAALAPLNEASLGPWLTDLHRGVRELERTWEASLTPSATTGPPISGTRSSQTHAWRALEELRSLRQQIEAARHHLDGPESAAAVLQRCWTLRDLAIFASADLRMLDAG